MAPTIDADGWITAVNDTKTSPFSPAVVVVQPVDSASSSSSSTTDSSSSSSAAPAVTASVQTETETPTRPRLRPPALHLQSAGMDPKLLVGKVLKRIRRSATHPAVTLSFADDTAYQVLVDGYNPRHGRASMRVLEMDGALQELFDPPGGHIAVDLVVKDCALIQLTDKAYEGREWEQRWDQSHIAIAFKFEGERKWHCVWAMLAEYDDLGRCMFRTFDDVYLQPLVRSPQRSPQKAKNRNWENWRKDT